MESKTKRQRKRTGKLVYTTGNEKSKLICIQREKLNRKEKVIEREVELRQS